MGIRVSLQGDFKNPRTLKTWSLEEWRRYRRAVRREMVAAQPGMKSSAKRSIAARFKVRKSSFPKAWGTRLYDQKKAEFPAMLLQTRIPWLAAHEVGATIAPSRGSRLLVLPIGRKKRVGYQKWKRMLRAWMASGNTFWRKSSSGKLLLYLQKQGGNRKQRSLRGFGTGAVPVAIGLPRVKLTKRFDMRQVAKRPTEALARRIERRVDVGDRLAR